MDKSKNINGYPTSVAIIMDGNGRWAKKRLLPRTAGHVAGAKNVRSVLNALKELGVRYVTLYAFSTENWKRPKEEVDAIMSLLYKYLDEVAGELVKKDSDFSVRFLGDKSALPEKLQKKCIEVENIAKDRALICNIALNYGGRDEIVHAANMAIADGHTTLDEQTLARYMYTSDIPDPDLVIRTGGDFRVSNFLLWQIAYSEFYITDTYWPDFGKSDIKAAFDSFASRKRRFGGLDAEDKNSENG